MKSLSAIKAETPTQRDRAEIQRKEANLQRILRPNQLPEAAETSRVAWNLFNQLIHLEGTPSNLLSSLEVMQFALG